MLKNKTNIALIFCLFLSMVTNIVFVNRYGIIKKIVSRVIAPPCKCIVINRALGKDLLISIGRCQ